MEEEKITEYINEKLFTEIKPVLFTDLIAHFKIGPSRAKKFMYSYYKSTSTVTNVKFNCILMCCYSNGTIKLINDLKEVTPNENENANGNEMVDCFIYAFNPMDTFIPVNIIVDQLGSLSIKNPYKLTISEKSLKAIDTRTLQRSKTVNASSSVSATTSPRGINRATTVPDTLDATKRADKVEADRRIETPPVKKAKKSMGLKSTVLLEKMRKNREAKEAERQMELKKRREEALVKQVKKDPKMKAQMDELNKLFVEDDEEGEDDDLQNISSDEKVVSESIPLSTGDDESEEPEIVPKNNNIEKKKSDTTDMEAIFDTTAEESLLEISNPTVVAKGQDEVEREEESAANSSYVDEDGYIVTKRPAVSTPSQPSKRQQTRPIGKTTTPVSRSKRPGSSSGKKKQGSIESFFKRSSK
ncbi:DNA polymerase delta subunit POL32 NDAI_0G04780 [Naumovozyma dairenensis CBS 421]|uniref:DNA polymerase delta subunit 3 n=1 Tax=Naumovozyma dairenensis (strain ATCC 10597 / BCRC 20456 / CBS 421 / NBRC 0211 / NRRL Y-12639) TaxID=1071378 RepID=J7S4H8_NAUDC|nr:hypothetical protein NDAI_0G04780 [Naumovozyma dairenensis CBS 421]CCK73461.1 hypothetical protein NDAI_0G04780 [Naumovozyma dairenensis CBS 421]